MSIQADVLHSTVVRALDDLDTTEGEIIAVGIVAAFRDENGKEWYRTYSDRETYFEQVGIFRAGLEVIEIYDELAEDEDE